MQLRARLITGSLLALVIALVVSAFPQAQTVAKFGHTRPQASTVITPPPGGSLIQQANLVGVGGFRIPSGTFNPDGDHFDYGGYGLGYTPNDGTYGAIYTTTSNQRIGELLVPSPALWSSSATLSNYQTATMYRTNCTGSYTPGCLTRVTDTLANENTLLNGAGANGLVTGDCKPWGSYLYCTQQLTYDAGCQGGNQPYSMFRRSPDTSNTSSFSGWVQAASNWPFGNVTDTAGAPCNATVTGTWPTQHVTAGMLIPVPSAYVSSLGKMLVGNIGANIITTTSIGPDTFSFDPDAFSYGSTLPMTMLFGYRSEDYGAGAYATLGYWDPRIITESNLAQCAAGNQPLCPTGPSNKSYEVTGTSTIGGGVIPTGWRTLLVFGRGTQNFCYGIATSIQSEDGTYSSYDPNANWCYDPHEAPAPTVSMGCGNGHGCQPGVYATNKDYHVWAYDLNDLIAVKNGTNTKAYSVTPYANWSISIPSGTGVCQPGGQGDMNISGATLASIGGTEYVLVAFHEADSSDFYACKPVIYGFKVQ